MKPYTLDALLVDLSKGITLLNVRVNIGETPSIVKDLKYSVACDRDKSLRRLRRFVRQLKLNAAQRKSVKELFSVVVS